jgi:hypothetical protein
MPDEDGKDEGIINGEDAFEQREGADRQSIEGAEGPEFGGELREEGKHFVFIVLFFTSS